MGQDVFLDQFVFKVVFPNLSILHLSYRARLRMGSLLKPELMTSSWAPIREIVYKTKPSNEAQVDAGANLWLDRPAGGAPPR